MRGPPPHHPSSPTPQLALARPLLSTPANDPSPQRRLVRGSSGGISVPAGLAGWRRGPKAKSGSSSSGPGGSKKRSGGLGYGKEGTPAKRIKRGSSSKVRRRDFTGCTSRTPYRGRDHVELKSVVEHWRPIHSQGFSLLLPLAPTSPTTPRLLFSLLTSVLSSRPLCSGSLPRPTLLRSTRDFFPGYPSDHSSPKPHCLSSGHDRNCLRSRRRRRRLRRLWRHHVHPWR
jgi:hypothetical protein